MNIKFKFIGKLLKMPFGVKTYDLQTVVFSIFKLYIVYIFSYHEFSRK